MVCIYHMVSEQAPFNPTDYTELMEPHFNQPKVVLNNKNVFAYLQSQGYDPSLLVKRSDESLA